MLLSRDGLLSGSAVGLVAALSVVACGGDKSGDREAASAGTGGSSAGTGGSTSATGSATAVEPYECMPAEPPPSPDLTANIDSSGNWGDKATFGGGTFSFGDADGDKVTDVTVDYASNSLHVTGKAATYAGFGLWFGPANKQTIPCIDAHAYQGVSFHITDTGGTLNEIKLSVQSHETAPVDVANKRGGCVYSADDKKFSECVYPSATVPVPSEGGVIEVPWASLTGGIPVATTDGAALDGLQWQFPWMPPSVEYAVDITIKDVKFY